MPLNTTYLRKLPGNKDLPWFIATVGGLGFFTSMPGTLGSAAAFLVYAVWRVPVTVIMTVIALGTWASQAYSSREGVSDPREVIIDEVAGTWISMYGLSQGYLLPALFLFRVLDILKPFPVNAAEKLPGGWGIMADDIVAGIMVNVLLTAIKWLYFEGGFSFFNLF